MIKTKLILAALVVLSLSCFSANAHTLRPAIATITFEDNSRFKLEVLTNVEALLADIGPQHSDTEDAPTANIYDELRGYSPEKLKAVFSEFAPHYLNQLEIEFDDRKAKLSYLHIDVPPKGDVDLARKSRIHISGSFARNAVSFRWSYPEKFGSVVLKLRFSGNKEIKSFWLKAGAAPLNFGLDQELTGKSRLQTGIDYIVLGFTHIVPKGLDHILFVVGIFLLSLKLAPILWQITAFTIAHTITLALTIYGYISLSPSIVEPLIALSIVYVGLENVFTNRLKPWRVLVVFIFGLLHGMGFAGVLTEIGLPRSEFVTALLTFNVGVELGQLAVIGVALLLVGWFRHQVWYRPRVVIPVSLIIALVGLYWSVDRVMWGELFA